MSKHHFTRRDFMKASSVLFATLFPGAAALAQSTSFRRLNWDTFKTTADYSSFVDGIASMRANTNSADKRSWTYWVNVHLNYCPHNTFYFLAWHRGYLYYFEQQLRAVSGNKKLILPYWDYYINPSIPPEFTNPASYNSLYHTRVNNNVINALTLAPYADTVVNMQRGLDNAYEPSFESLPHNQVHNIIGDVMADMQSPLDPIFWLHHANVDRLWSAWELAGGGRIVPPSTDTYWSGTFIYSSKLTMARGKTIDTRTYLSYYYQNETMPTSLPVAAVDDTEGSFRLAAMTNDIQLAQLAPRPSTNTPRLLTRPPVANFQLSESRSTGPDRLSLVGALLIPLSEESVTMQLPLSASSSKLLQNVLDGVTRLPGGRLETTTQGAPYRSAQLVLDNVHVTDPGKAGGYFYYIFVNLPSGTDLSSATNTYLIGTLGPFEVNAALHRAHMNLGPGGSEPGTALLSFPATLLLKQLMASDQSGITVSFVRSSGDNSASGEAIIIGEARLELSLDPIE